MVSLDDLVTRYFLILFGTEQREAHPYGTLVKDPTINAGRNRFLFTTFQSWWGSEHFSSELCSPIRPSTSLGPHQAISQKPPEVPYLI